jgi:hypothetical protein
VLLAGVVAMLCANACSVPAPTAADKRLQDCQARHVMLETAGVEPSMSPAQRLHWCQWSLEQSNRTGT